MSAAAPSFRVPLRSRAWRAAAVAFGWLAVALVRAHRAAFRAGVFAAERAAAARVPRGRTFTPLAWAAVAVLLAAYAVAVLPWSPRP